MDRKKKYLHDETAPITNYMKNKIRKKEKEESNEKIEVSYSNYFFFIVI